MSRNATDPERSGESVAALLEEGDLNRYKQQVRVIDLAQLDPTLGKGSQVVAGLKDVIQKHDGFDPADIAVYTDADITIDLRQLGLLLGPMVLGDDGFLKIDEHGKITSRVVASGSRYSSATKRNLFSAEGFEDIALPGGIDPLPDAESDHVKVVTRKYVVEPFLHPSLARQGIRDSQIGLRAYPRSVLEEILPRAVERRFSFDTELIELAIRAGATFDEASIMWSDSPEFSNLQTALGRWENFLDWLEQYRRMNPNSTLDETDLARIDRITRDAIAEAMQGGNTLEMAEELRDFVTSDAQVDKYFSYPLVLRVNRELTAIASAQANLKKYLAPYKGQYRLEPRENRPVGVFDPLSHQVLLDEGLTQLAPNFAAGSAKTAAFQAFVDDIFRHATGDASAVTANDSIEYLRNHPAEARQILETLETAGGAVQFTRAEYEQSLREVADAASLGLEQNIGRALEVLKADQMEMRLAAVAGLNATRVSKLDQLIFNAALSNARAFLIVDKAGMMFDMTDERLAEPDYAQKIAVSLQAVVDQFMGQTVILTGLSESAAVAIRQYVPQPYQELILLTSESSEDRVRDLAKQYSPDAANIAVLYSSQAAAEQTFTKLGQNVFELKYDSSDPMLASSESAKQFAVALGGKLALFGIDAAAVLRQEEDLDMTIPGSRVVHFDRTTLQQFIDKVLKADLEAKRLLERAA